jgi:hypothetical protein
MSTFLQDFTLLQLQIFESGQRHTAIYPGICQAVVGYGWKMGTA